MARIGIIVVDGARLGGIGSLIDTFDRANRYTERQYDTVGVVTRPAETLVLTERGRPCRLSSGRMLPADAAWADAAPLDLVYFAAFHADDESELEASLVAAASLHDWIAARRAEGALIAASEAAVFHLAEAGVFDGQTATAPWWLERAFRRRYPRVALDVPRVIVEGEGYLCTGTTRGEPALALRLAERVLSANVANWLAKATLVDPYPDGPAPWSVFSPRVLRQDGLVGRAQHWLQQRFSQQPRMSDLAAFLGVSARTLERRFRKSLGMSPLDYLQILRVEAAKQMLARSSRRVERVAQLVGYSDSAFFKQVFRAQTGLSPREYRRRAAVAAPRSP